MYTDSDLESFRHTAIHVAKTAGEKIKEAFEYRQTRSAKSSNVEFKDRLDLVTETDKACEQIAYDMLISKYPSHLFLGEESVASGQKYELRDEPTWIIDPIDGTTNFVHGVPFTCISIALAIQKEVVLGVVFNPILNELFEAVKNKGALLNGNPIHSSSHDQLHHLLVATGFPTDRTKEKVEYIVQNLKSILFHVRDIRRLGSAALDICGVACGRLDAYFEFHIHAWDIAAGVLILQEASGIAIDPSGKPLDLMSGKVLCCNSQHMANELVKVMLPIPPNLF